MKKYYLIISILYFGLAKVHAQSGLIDPYRLNFVNSQNIGPIPKYSNSSSQIVYDSELPAGPGGYEGEYMIGIREHPISIPAIFNNLALRYKMEVVSFPFTINCWNDNGCASTSLNRIFEMPDELYNSNLKGWGTGSLSSHYLKNVRDEGTFYQSAIMGVHFSGADNHPEALVSTAFLNNTFLPGLGWRHVLPHTVIKHKIYIYCTSSFTSEIIDSVEWVYDNTRGRMKYYPFKNVNSFNNGDEGRYDVVYAPEIISIPEADHNYTDIGSNSAWIDGGTIDYFPFRGIQIISECPTANLYTTMLESNPFKQYNLSTGDYTTFLADAPPYSLLSSILRNKNMTTFAGYKINISQIEIEPGSEGIVHAYYINRGFPDFNLTVINGSDKIIYNPSIVTLDPNLGDPMGNNAPIKVIFPANYTFKTVLGRYPSYQEVQDANNDTQNGGPYNMIDVPVPVDAADRPYAPGTTSLDYPPVSVDYALTNDPNGFLNDERFGYYIINKDATLQVENCVKIFDARFQVNTGGTLEFNDYSQILGFEDTAANLGRYKIRGEGGAILRNNKNVQYIQNGNIVQSTPLNYIASSLIICGNSVDPDQPTGSYQIFNGANVTFKAGNYIHLTDGFYVSGGNFHAVIDENLPVPIECYSNNSQNGGNRLQHQILSTIQHAPSSSIIATPNPSQGTFLITIKGDNSISSISVFDNVGRLIYHKSNLNDKTYEIQLTPGNKGLMLTEITGSNGKISRLKVIVE